MSEKQVWFITGAGRERAQILKAQADAFRELSSSLAHDTPAPEYA
jgi:hypothetical protein